MIRSAWIWRSIASLFETRRPCASTATKVTSAIPIISAAAVAAVRPGLRCALPSASVPATPPIRRAGMPTTFASGTTSRDESIATPTKSDSTPMPSSAKRSPVRDVVGERAVRERDHGDRHDHAGDVGREAGPPCRAAASRPRARRRSAARGWRARPGRARRTTVTSVPTSNDTTIVRVAKTVVVCGKSRLRATKSSFRPTASPRPAEEPDDRGEEADHERLHDHRSSTCRATRRSSAASRTRESAARP